MLHSAHVTWTKDENQKLLHHSTKRQMCWHCSVSQLCNIQRKYLLLNSLSKSIILCQYKQSNFISLFHLYRFIDIINRLHCIDPKAPWLSKRQERLKKVRIYRLHFLFFKNLWPTQCTVYWHMYQVNGHFLTCFSSILI